MKKLLALVLTLAMMAALAVPAMAATITAPKAAITIDGTRDDAYGGPWDIAAYRSDDMNGATGKLWAAWDDNFIYYFIEVNDATPNHEHGNSYERDCVELFFDWYNAKEDDTSDDTKPYWQYRIMSAPNEDGEQFNHTINHAALGWGPYDDDHQSSMEANIVVNYSATGYSFEIGIEYKKFGVNIAEGAVVGVDYQIGDNQDGEGRTSQAFFTVSDDNDNQWQYPYACGGLLVLGPAAAAPPPPEETPAEEAPAVGGGEAAPEPPPVAVPTSPPSAPTGDAGMVTLIALMAAAAFGAAVLRKKIR